MKYSINQDGALNRRKLFQDDSLKQQDFCHISSGVIDEEDFAFRSKTNFPQINSSQAPNNFLQNETCANVDHTLSYVKQTKVPVNCSLKTKDSIDNLNEESNQKQLYNSIRLNERRQSKQLSIQIDKKDAYLTIQQMKQVKKSKLMQMIKSDIEQQEESQKESNCVEEDKQKEEPQNQEIKIITFFYIYKFIKSFLLKYVYSNSSLLQAFQIKIINDKSSNLQVEKKSKKDKNVNQVMHNNIFDFIHYLRAKREENSRQQSIMLQKQNYFLNILVRKLNSYIYQIQIVSPNVFQLLIWDIIALLAYVFLVIVYPFILSFEITESQQDFVDYIQIFYLGMILFDSFLGFHIGIYEFGEIVKERTKVYDKYYQDRLLFDLMSVFALIIGVLTKKYICCLFSIIFRYSSILDKVSRINMNLQIQSKLKAYYDLLKLVFYIIILIHIFGCGFYYIGAHSCSSQNEMNWIKDQNLDSSSQTEQYINSIYFITITMVTIGYGEIHPINQYEKLYTIIVAFITCGFFAFSLNLIGQIAQDIQKKSLQLQKKQQIIQAYLNNRQIENLSQIRVLKYLEFLNGSQEETNLEGQKILQTCSKSIREDILREYYGRILNKCQIFKENFSKELVNRLSLKMKEKSFAPGEAILEKGSYMQELYFIKSGKTEYFFKAQNENKFVSENEQQIIDLKTFLSQTASDIQVRSQGITSVIYIEYNEFMETFEHLKNDKERLCQMKDQFIYQQSYQYPCQSCGQYKHTLFNCPLITYQINKSQLLKKYNHSEQQERDEYFYKKKQQNEKKIFKTRSQNNEIKFDLKLIRCDLVNYFYNLNQDKQQTKDIIMKMQNDKQFYQTLPKIYQLWFNQKGENENEPKENLQDKTLLNSLFGAQNELFNNDFSTSSYSSSTQQSSQSDYSDSYKQSTLQSKVNPDKIPSIANQESIQMSIVFQNDNIKNPTQSKQELDVENQSQNFIQSENKIVIPNQSKNNNFNTIEECLSPAGSSQQISHDNQNDQATIEQFKQIQNKVKFNIARRDQRNKSFKNSCLSLNTQQELKQQSRSSLNTKIYKEPSSPIDEQHREGIILNNGGGQNSTPIQPNQQRRPQRISVIQCQLQEQILMLQDILKNQQRHSNKSFMKIGTTLSKLKSIKYSAEIKGIQANINNFKNQNTYRHKIHSQNDIPLIQQEINCIFGKCGQGFEVVKEFEYYCPKFNFSQVIKAYKKFLSFHKRTKNFSEENNMFKSVKKHVSIRPKVQQIKNS